MSHPALRTRICELFGCELPVVQTGMGWVSGARLTAATSAAGGFGILAAATMTYEELEAAIGRVKARTDRPFGVNLRGNQPGMERYLELILREGVRVASFAGPPSKESIRTLVDAGVVTMPTIGAPRHAQKMADWGVDAVIAQGGEGGGHTGSIPTSLLLPEVCKVVEIPVLGAGGFRDGAGLVAALAWGAAGIAMGTRFLLTQESRVPDEVKQVYLKTPLTGTVVTTAIDGAPQRVIRTEVVEALERSGPWTRLPRAVANALRFRALTDTPLGALLREALSMKKAGSMSWAEVAMAANAPMLTRATMVEGKLAAGILPTGQVAGAIGELPTVAQLLERITEEAEQALARLGVPPATQEEAG